MKKLSILYVAVALFMVSCADDSLSPIITFDKAGKGAYVKLISLNSVYDLANYSTSAYNYDVEFVDEQQGSLVSSYDLYVTYVAKSGTVIDEKAWKSFGQGDFSTAENGYKAMNVNIPLSEIATLMGLGEADLAPGDQFEFRTEVILTNGAKFTKTNSSAAVNGSAFQGYFDFDAKVTCPLPDEKFTGVYKLEYIEYDPTDAFDYAFGATPGNVEIYAVTSTLRAFDFSYLPDSYNFDGQTLQFDVVCTEVQPNNVDTGVGCGGGSITIGVATNTPADINDDSEFTMDLIDYNEDGGCGVPQIPMKVKLTRI